jgi:hypothetical protein
LGIDRAELLPEDEVVRQVRVVAGQLQQLVTGVIPMGDPWIAPEQDESAVHLPAGTTVMPPGQSAALSDDGPPTESLHAVEDPPAVPNDCQIGRVFTDATEWERVDFMPVAVVNRVGDWWEYSHIPSGQSLLAAVYDCPARDITHSFAELLHMHGMLWEVLDASEQQSGVAGQETAVDHGC